MKQAFIKVLLGIAALWAMAPASAALIHFRANLSGPAENPPNASPGVGIVFVDFDTLLNTLFIQATFSGLLGTTTSAHIHCCAPSPTNSQVATVPPAFPGFPMGVTSGSYTGTLDLTQLGSYNAPFVTAHGGTAASAEAFLIAGMSAGQSYFNIHTTAFPGGEIRGFLVVPEPWTVSLLGMGLAVGLSSRRRTRV